MFLYPGDFYKGQRYKGRAVLFSDVVRDIALTYTYVNYSKKKV